jgi:squalene-hopene/tetraprenyl-beta-curcumene cyclase
MYLSKGDFVVRQRHHERATVIRMRATVLVATLATIGVIAGSAAPAPQSHGSAPSWNARAAAGYLDGRMEWWLHWPNAARDHDTACVSCHTALPYALARPALHALLAERESSPQERAMVAHVEKRVRMWREVEPFYPDQTRGLPKSSESRGTEAVLNALVLAARDASTGTLSDAARQAFANMWALQFTAGDLKGAWAWLNFHYEPWESSESGYYGAALAALAVGMAPGGYASSPEIQDRMKLLREYLQRTVDNERLFNRLTALWAGTTVPNLLTAEQRHAILEAAAKTQQADGGWATAGLGTWKRVDGTPLEMASDGYATGLVTLVLQRAGAGHSKEQLGRAVTWLTQHQDASTGHWPASSLNKKRDPASDIGKFMSDAATAYAVLALAGVRDQG